MAMTRIDKAIKYGEALLDPPTDYGQWGGEYPFRAGAPMWAYVKTGQPPNPKNEVPNTSCTGLVNLMAAAGGSDFRGGTLLYGQKIKNKRDYRPGMRLRRGEVLVSAFGWGDEGHIVMVLEDGTDPLTIGSDHTAGRTKPGVNRSYRAQKAHQLFGFEWVGEVPGLELGAPAEEEIQEPRPDSERPDSERPDADRPEQEAPLFTAKQLIEMADNPNLGQATAEKYRDALIPEMRKAGVTTPLRMAAFFGNVMVETAQLNTLEEYGDRDYWMYLDRNSGRAGEWRYHGRGFLMNTWRSAYANLSRVLDVDLVANPDMLERPDLAAKAAMWFWKQNNLNTYADRGDFKAVCSIINTGRSDRTPNHWEQRLHFFDVAKRVLKSGPGATGDGFDRNGFNRDGLPYINIAAVGQADETAAFALATEIRRAGIGVTVTNGADNVYALAKKIRPEHLGYRQLWILGEPARDACGEYAELANWPASPKTDYYDLAGKDFTGTCRRAAELADKKAKEGVGRRFLEEMETAGAARTKSPLPKPVPPQDEAREPEEDGSREEDEERRRRRREERVMENEEDQDYPQTASDAETASDAREEREHRERREVEESRRRRAELVSEEDQDYTQTAIDTR